MVSEKEVIKKTNQSTDALLVDFFMAVSRIESKNEAELFLSDLLTKKELRMLARRLRIAILLSLDFTFSEIVKEMRVGRQTVSTVHHWLEEEGAGYRLVIDKIISYVRVTSNQTPNTTCSDNKYRSGKYSQYYWPAELISAIGAFTEKSRSRTRKG